MDKEQSDHIENRIRQAAENMSPPVNEEAWEKMEVLLDKENKKKRRRGIIWWPLLLLLLLGGAGVYYNVNKQPRAIKSSGNKQSDRKAIPPAEISRLNPEPQPKVRSKTFKEPKKGPLKLNEPEKLISQTSQPIVKKKSKAKKINETRVNKKITDIESRSKMNKSKIVSGQSINYEQREKDTDYLSKKNNVSIDKDAIASPPDNSLNKVELDTLKNTTINLPPDSAASSSQTNTFKAIKNASGIYFTAMVAPDGSAVKNRFHINEVKTFFGAGIGYRFNRVSVQTGFYAGRKIYTAGPGDYRPKPGSYLDRVDLRKTDADCYIYDIPLSIRYDVVQKRRFSVYAVTGVSSYLLKKEKYRYHYFRSGMYRKIDTTFKGNKNLFSVANFSIGFEQKLSNAFYLQAEPFFKIPLSGLGEGKVRLYSAGLQFGLKYQPLKK